MSDTVNHPAHYGGADNPYEVIKVIEAWNLGFCLGNAVKYIGRAGKKNPATTIEDLKKAQWYLEREINRLVTANTAAKDRSVTTSNDSAHVNATPTPEPVQRLDESTARYGPRSTGSAG